MSSQVPAVLGVPVSGALAIDKGDDSRITIRRFVDSGIQSAVDKAIANLAREGKNVAVLAVVNQDKAGAAFMARIGDQWSVVAVAEKPWDGPLKLEAAIRWSV